MAGERPEERSSGARARAFRLVPDPALTTPFTPVTLALGASTVGRVKGCEIQVEGDLVSRRHAKLVVTEDGLVIHDLDSHNGVFVNGKKVRSGPVGDGDKIYFGNICAHVHEVESDAAAPSLTESSLMQEPLVGPSADQPSTRAFQTLCTITDLLLTESDEVFFNEVIRHMVDFCEGSVCAIFRPDGSGRLHAAHVAFGEAAGRKEVPFLASVLERVMREHVVLYTKGDISDPVLEGQELGAALAVPLVAAGKAIGVLLVGRAANAGFSDRVVETVSAISHLVSIRLTGFVSGQDGDETAVRVGLDTAEGSPAALDQLRSDLAAAQSAAALATEASSSARAELDALRAGEANNAQQIIQLRQQLADADADQKELSRALEQARQELEAATKSGATRAAEHAESEAAKHALKAEADAFRERSAAAEKEIALLQEKQAEIESAKASVEEELAGLVGERDQIQTKYAEMQNDLAAAAVERLNLQDARLAAEGEIEQSRQELTQATAELEETRKTLGDAQSEREKLKTAVGEAAEDGARKVLSIVRDTLPARAVHRIKAAATGEPVDRDLQMAPSTIVTVRIKDVDQWAQTAAPDQLKARLDNFCQSIRVLAAANGGELAQVLGAAHLLTFGGDNDGIREGLTCAREIASSLGPDIGGGIQIGVHAGAALSGFFGDETGASFLHLGEAVVVSRGASEFAPPGAVWATETVRSALANDGDFLFIATGPHLVRGYANPFNLFQVGTAG